MSSRALNWVAVTAAVAVVAGAGASYALATGATNGASYSLSFSPNKPKTSSSLTINLTSAQQPQTATIAFPAGVALNLRSVPYCSAPPGCDPLTQVGSGTASVDYEQYVIPVHFIVFNHAGGLAVVISNPNGSPVVVAATWSGTTLVLPYPNGVYKGQPIRVAKLSITFDQLGSGRSAFLRTPATCSKAGWSSTASLAFAGGVSSTSLSATAKCQIPKKPKKKHKKHG